MSLFLIPSRPNRSTRRSTRRPGRKNCPVGRTHQRAFQLSWEALEGRLLMATWAPAGPSPQQVASDYGGFPSPGSPVTGRVTGLAFGQNLQGQSVLYLGAAGAVCGASPI